MVGVSSGSIPDRYGDFLKGINMFKIFVVNYQIFCREPLSSQKSNPDSSGPGGW